MDKNDLKLKKALLKWGVTEDEAEAFINELKEDVTEETEVEQPLPEGEQVEVEAEEVGETEEVEPAPVEAETETEELPMEEAPVEEVSEVAEEPQVEQPMEEQPQSPNEINPAEIAPEQEQEPQVDVVGLQHANDELQKALDGVTARLSALEDSLKKAGVLVCEGQRCEVGIDEAKVPANDPYDNPMEDVLSQINHRNF